MSYFPHNEPNELFLVRLHPADDNRPVGLVVRADDGGASVRYISWMGLGWNVRLWLSRHGVNWRQWDHQFSRGWFLGIGKLSLCWTTVKKPYPAF